MICCVSILLENWDIISVAVRVVTCVRILLSAERPWPEDQTESGCQTESRRCSFSFPALFYPVLFSFVSLMENRWKCEACISFPQIENPHLRSRSSSFTISPKVGLHLVGVALAHKRLHLSWAAPVDSRPSCVSRLSQFWNLNHARGAKKVHKYKWHGVSLARNSPLRSVQHIHSCWFPVDYKILST